MMRHNLQSLHLLSTQRNPTPSYKRNIKDIFEKYKRTILEIFFKFHDEKEIIRNIKCLSNFQWKEYQNFSWKNHTQVKFSQYERYSRHQIPNERNMKTSGEIWQNREISHWRPNLRNVKRSHETQNILVLPANKIFNMSLVRIGHFHLILVTF